MQRLRVLLQPLRSLMQLGRSHPRGMMSADGPGHLGRITSGRVPASGGIMPSLQQKNGAADAIMMVLASVPAAKFGRIRGGDDA